MQFTLVLFTLLAFQLYGQKTYFVKDAQTEESIPFVKIYPEGGIPFLADLDGAFQLSGSTSQFTLKYGSYKDTTVLVSAIIDSIVYLSQNIQMVDEITVVPGKNPAHRIMRHAIENRKANHPLKNDAFRYNSYSKFIFIHPAVSKVKPPSQP